MERHATFYLLAFFAGISFWFHANTKLEIDYRRHPQLVDEVTGVKRSPSELLDLAKIINITENYVQETSAEQRLYDLAYYSNFENPFIIDHSYSDERELELAAGEQVNQTRCGQQLDWILERLERHPNYTQIKGRLGYELTQFMDSFGKPEAGLYSGSINWLGGYRQCLRAKLQNGNIQSRYCLARMRPSWWPQKERMYPITSIKVGICLPDTCDTRSYQLEENREKIDKLAKWELGDRWSRSLNFSSLFCLPDEQSKLRQMPQSGRIYLALVGGWLLLVLVGSILYEHQRRRRLARERKMAAFMAFDTKQKLLILHQEKQQHLVDSCQVFYKILEALSIRHSLKLFKTNRFCVRYKQKHRVRVNVGGMDFFKISMALCVVLGHSGFLAKIYARSLNNRIDLSIGYAGRLALSVSRCVDVFFLFFGILTAYTLLRKFSQRQLGSPLTWILVNLGIFLRVGPLFMLVYWYARSVSPYTGDGPWWDYGVDQFSMKGVCLRDPWWKSVPYFGSLGTPPVPSCNLPSWFIVTYLQISLLMPLIVYLICRLPTYLLKFTFTGSLALISGLSISARLLAQTSVREEAFSLYGGFLSDLMEKFESTGHITTLGRVGIVAMGCLIGYLLRQYEENHISDWPKWVRSKLTVWLASLGVLLIVLAPMIGHKIYLVTGRLVSLYEFVGANLLLTLLFPCLVSLVVLNLATVHNHLVVTRFFSHSFWHAFNRLGLSIFLVHWEVLFYGMTSFEHAPGYGFFTEVAKMWSFGACLSILIAFCVHILIETPLAELLNIVMTSFMAKNRTNDETDDAVVEEPTKELPA